MSRIALTSHARAALGLSDRIELHVRAASMGVHVHAGRNTRRDCWRVVVRSGPLSTELHGQGPLAVVIAGALDDWVESMVAA